MGKRILLLIVFAISLANAINIENATCKMFENEVLFRSPKVSVSIHTTKDEAYMSSSKGESVKLKSTGDSTYLNMDLGIVLKISDDNKSFSYTTPNNFSAVCTAQ